jgi:hypothetical protein
VIRQARGERGQRTLFGVGHLTTSEHRHEGLACPHRVLHLLRRHAIGKLPAEEPTLTGTTLTGTTLTGTTLPGTTLTGTALTGTTARHRHAVLLHAVAELGEGSRAIGATGTLSITIGTTLSSACAVSGLCSNAGRCSIRFGGTVGRASGQRHNSQRGKAYSKSGCDFHFVTPCELIDGDGDAEPDADADADKPCVTDCAVIVPSGPVDPLMVTVAPTGMSANVDGDCDVTVAVAPTLTFTVAPDASVM